MTTTQRTFPRFGLAGLALAAGACVMTSGIATAAGCNGVVDQFKWGCAAWDNNNGPQYPHYKAPKAQQPARPAPPQQVQRPVVVPNPSSGIVANNGGRVVGQNGASVVGQNGANVVGQNGANLQQR